VQTVIFFLFFKGFIGKPKNTLLILISGISYVTIVSLSNIYLDGNFAILISIFCISLLSFLYTGKWYIKLFAAIILIISMLAADAIIIFLLTWFSNITPTELFDYAKLSILQFIMYISGVLTLLIITKIVVRFRNRNNTKLKLKYWLGLLTIPVISIAITFVIFDLNAARVCIEDSRPFSMLAMLGILCINILVFVIFENFLEQAAIEKRNNALEEQCREQAAQYEIVKLEQLSKRSFLHDFDNVLDTLVGIAKNNKADDVLEYISSVKQVNAVNKDVVHTGNIVVDSVFNAKIRRAESMGISVIAKNVFIPPNIKLDPTDMVILFANSFDNAIEACARIEKGDKHIEIGLQYIIKDKRLVYRITNHTDGNLVKGAKRFKTSKPTTEAYGLGLENMERVVEKYRGVFKAEHLDKSNIFELSSVIYNV